MYLLVRQSSCVLGRRGALGGKYVLYRHFYATPLSISPFSTLPFLLRPDNRNEPRFRFIILSPRVARASSSSKETNNPTQQKPVSANQTQSPTIPVDLVLDEAQLQAQKLLSSSASNTVAVSQSPGGVPVSTLQDTMSLSGEPSLLSSPGAPTTETADSLGKPAFKPFPKSRYFTQTRTSLQELGLVTAEDSVGSSRKFISVVRAMSDFLLSPRHLETLPKFKRRSPYENEPPIVVFRRKDVEKKAIEIFGSLSNVGEERRKRLMSYRQRRSLLQDLKSRIIEFGHQKRVERNPFNVGSIKSKALQTSAKVVYTAIVINSLNTVLKFGAWVISGSHSVFAELLHSLADTINQVVLLVGMRKSMQDPDSRHPYGYTSARYVASLISGVGILCLGSGLSIYHGIAGLMHPTQLDQLPLAIFVLAGSFISEGSCLIVAANAIRSNAALNGMSKWDYLMYGDPSISFVFLEDLAAVLGVVVAASCMTCSVYFQSHIPDSVGSIIVGVLLAWVAQHIMIKNSAALVGSSIPNSVLVKLNRILENDALIRGVHDVKGMDMGNSLIRYKAEIDIDGLELTRRYLRTVDLDLLLSEMQGMKSPIEVEAFLLKHGEQIVDRLGAEIDRIEGKLKEAVPDVRHVDLEVL